MDYSKAEELVKNGKIKSLWNTEMTDILLWFETAVLPTKAFQLDPCRQIINPVKFYQALQMDVEAGPKGPRARTGALQEDLKLLHRLITAKAENKEAV